MIRRIVEFYRLRLKLISVSFKIEKITTVTYFFTLYLIKNIQKIGLYVATAFVIKNYKFRLNRSNTFDGFRSNRNVCIADQLAKPVILWNNIYYVTNQTMSR